MIIVVGTLKRNKNSGEEVLRHAVGKGVGPSTPSSTTTQNKTYNDNNNKFHSSRTRISTIAIFAGRERERKVCDLGNILLILRTFSLDYYPYYHYLPMGDIYMCVCEGDFIIEESYVCS